MDSFSARLAQQAAGQAFDTGTIMSAEPGQAIRVHTIDGQVLECLWLENAQMSARLQPGDQVLFVRTNALQGVVLGRVGVYAPAPSTLSFEATEVLTLKCGDATLDLRADGKAVLKGEEVLIRARGLQRIKAGSVSIN
jgi:hypothetical protein